MSDAVREVITFVEMTDQMPNARSMASRDLRWARENLKVHAILFYSQRHRFHTMNIPSMQWRDSGRLTRLAFISPECR